MNSSPASTSSIKRHVVSLLGCLAVAAFVACDAGGGGGAGAKREAASAPAEGQTAPEIEGTDADGKAFKLSDYKGKVVLVDFWGDW